MKKILSGVIAILCCLPLVVSAADKVKVYIFYAGGCPACEAQIEYLEGLDGYNKTFEVVEKELYIDHIDWKQGADYELGTKVADAFSKAGYDASVNATPLVVISDSYAVNSYNSALETVINEVAKSGDKDIVGCIEDGRSDCDIPIIEQTGNDTYNNTGTTTSNASLGSNNMVVVMSAIISTIVIVAVYLIKSNIDKTQILEVLNKKK